MKKRNKIFAAMLILLLSSCSQGNLSINTSSVENGLNSSENQKYVSAKRIYDFQYDPQGYDQEILTLSEFPDLVFKRDEKKLGFYIEGKSDFGNLDSIYIGDFNNDGYADLGFAQRRGSGYFIVRHYVRIYDYHNDKFILDYFDKWAYLDTDENGYAIIEELIATPGNGLGLSELDRVGRFLKGETISFEWYSFDFKLKSLYLSPMDESYYKEGKLHAELNTPIKLNLHLRGIGKWGLENAIPFDQIKVKSNDEYYSFELKNGTSASVFNVIFTFLKIGTIELEVTIDQVTISEIIIVESN